MPWRLWRRVRIAPGLTLNVGKRGVSMSVGRRGMHYTVGGRGSRVTVGLPGTGLYQTTYLSARHHRASRSLPLESTASPSSVHFRRPGFWEFLIPGESVAHLIGEIDAERQRVFDLDKTEDRVQRLQAADQLFVDLWVGSQHDWRAVLHARPLSNAAINAVIESYRRLFQDLLAAAKHIRDQEHDALLGQRVPRPQAAAATALGDTITAADGFLGRLLEGGTDALALERDLRYDTESIGTRYRAFDAAMKALIPDFTPANPAMTFELEDDVGALHA